MSSSVQTGLAAALALLLSVSVANAQQKLTIERAISDAVATNPKIGEAAASRRAAEHEIRQAQGGLLPQVRVLAEYGSERNRTYPGTASTNWNNWHKAGGEVGVVVSQTLWDGTATIHEIYRQMARADAASWRTMERSELVALDAVEAYLDVVRFSSSLGHAARNVSVHRQFAANAGSRFSAGRTGTGDVAQVNERLQAALAVQADLNIRLDEAKAAFRRVVGREAERLAGATRPVAVPRSRKEALDRTLEANPSLQAARSDFVASGHEYDAASGAFQPKVTLEGKFASGRDVNDHTGSYDDASVKLKLQFPIYSGGSDFARQQVLSERKIETQMKLDTLTRSAFESVDRAWAAHTSGSTRVAALERQVGAAQRVVSVYQKEYELGQRSLLDLLNAQNALFNANLNLESARTVLVFADYQLLATTGQLLQRMSVAKPTEARVTPVENRSVIPSVIPKASVAD